MLAYYRGHVIVVLADEALSAEIIERASGTMLPTTVSAMPGETAEVVVERAKELVDTYLQERYPAPKPHYARKRRRGTVAKHVGSLMSRPALSPIGNSGVSAGDPKQSFRAVSNEPYKALCRPLRPPP